MDDVDGLMDREGLGTRAGMALDVIEEFLDKQIKRTNDQMINAVHSGERVDLAAIKLTVIYDLKAEMIRAIKMGANASEKIRGDSL